jgi:class 3 adenylate cyclase
MPDERRVVTVLFADVIESTELGESLDPEDLRSLLRGYYALAKEVVGHYGGTVEKFIGDAVMAVFGLPAAHSDDPHRALAAALEIRSRVRRDPSFARRVRIRFGINTGEVVAALDSSGGDFLVTGDAVNVAARLQQSARPWGILCGERTVRAAGMAFKFGSMYEVEVKGKRSSIRTAPLFGRRTVVLERRMPFVGREADLAQLDTLGRRALVEKHPAFVSVIAPAGIGKTRLLEEFVERLPAIAPGAVVLTGQCLPYGQRLTYWPLRAMLLRLVGLSTEAPPAEVRAGVRAWLGEPANAAYDRLADTLAGTIGAGHAEPTDRAAVQNAWRTLVSLASHRAPLVIVLEDLHWSSDSLLDLVDALQPRGEAPLLFIVLTRPELLDRRPGWGGGRRSYLALTLEPLDDVDVERLVRHVLPAASSEAVARLVRRAEGNPFYALELVRALNDRMVGIDDPASLERALSTLPDTVQATVLERLDLLGPEERRIVQLGSVLGRTFSAPGVVALAPEYADVVESAFEMLLAKDLIRVSLGDGYTFRHILIQEVAYQTLPRAERARLHAAAGRWLESKAAEREEVYAELIAYHFREAAAYARSGVTSELPADLRDKAVSWLQRAAEVALHSAADVEAVRHLRSAAELAERDRLPHIYERIGDAFLPRDSMDAYRLALELAREVDDSADRQLRAIAGMLHVTLRSGHTAGGVLSEDEVQELRADGRQLISLGVTDAAAARFFVAEAFLPFSIARGGSRGPSPADLDEAQAKASAALEIAERLDDAKLRSAAMDAAGSVMSVRGDYVGGRELARRRILMGDALDLAERLDAYAVATWLSVWLGELDEAIATSGRGLALVQPGQAPGWTLHLVSWRALALMRRGLWDEALAAGERARLLWEDLGRAPAAFALHGFLAALAIGHARRDARMFARFREPLEEIGLATARPAQRRLDPSDDATRPEHYLVHFDQRQPEAIELALAFASDAGRPPPMRVLQRLAASERLRSLPLLAAEVQRAMGLASGKAQPLETAIGLFDSCGAQPSAARARCERALLVGDDAELRRGLERLELLGDLEQIDRYKGATARRPALA